MGRRPAKRRKLSAQGQELQQATSEPDELMLASSAHPHAETSKAGAASSGDVNKGKSPALDDNEDDKAAEGSERDEEEVDEDEHSFELFAEEFHDVVVELPLEFQRNFLLLSELEESQQNAYMSLRAALAHHRSLAPRSTCDVDSDNEDTLPDPLRVSLQSVARSARSAVRAGEDKVGLAVALYETVDRHVRALDAALAKSEDALVLGLRDHTLPADPSAATASTSTGAKASTSTAAAQKKAGMTAGRGARALEASEHTDAAVKNVAGANAAALASADDKAKALHGMRVDPNEPTYCVCNRVSFGEMIACDNEDCSKEWFHLECIGLDRPPMGDWYCPDCRAELGVTHDGKPVAGQSNARAHKKRRR